MIRSSKYLSAAYLKAGEIIFSKKPMVIGTVLGSCLSITMHCARLGISAICHAHMPRCPGKGLCRDCADRAKYVDCSVRFMVERFARLGVASEEIEVKYFGGSDMFMARQKAAALISIGKENIKTAEGIIIKERLKVAARDVGGNRGRKIFFYAHTGEVLLKRLQPGAIPEEDQEIHG